jgi:NTP pyrophosphatase (non-canonical NTP hydrolase)
MSSIINEIKAFRDERDWKQFHNPKDLAIALNIESAELLELFLWKDANAANKDKIKEELADIMIYTYLLLDHFKLDSEAIIREKLQSNAIKYPVDKSRGIAKKYDEL